MNKTILITGASSGIGLASAELFARAGWNVVSTMRRPVYTDESNSPNQMVQQLDVEDPVSIQRAVDSGLARFGRIDVLLNNAGYGQYGLFEALSEDKIRAQFEVNVFGVMAVTREVLPHFRKMGGGTLVNVSSGAGHFTLPMISIYCASKFALEGFTEAISFELASQNIRTKLVIPHGGVTSTRFSERQAQDAPTAELEDYRDFVSRTGEAFGRMTASRSQSASEVAEVIFTAVTDGSDQLRYFVGDGANGFLRARQELPEDEYIKFMRSTFSR